MYAFLYSLILYPLGIHVAEPTAVLRGLAFMTSSGSPADLALTRHHPGSFISSESHAPLLLVFTQASTSPPTLTLNETNRTSEQNFNIFPYHVSLPETLRD